MSKILINLPTVNNDGIGAPWLYKIKYFQEQGLNTYLNNGIKIEKIEKINNVYEFNKSFQKNHQYLKFKNNSKLIYIYLCIKRNIFSLNKIKKISSAYNTIYSPSSVLDLIIVPFLVKKINNKIKWITILDNIVPPKDPGDKIVRTVSWIFFNISISLIRSADHIFVISPDIKKYLLKNNFDSKKITVTGNAIENDLIKKTPKQIKKIDALFIGRINETKGIYDMLKVLKTITKIYPNFQLNIMGDNDKFSKEKFIKKIHDLKLEKNVKFLGFITGIKKFKIIKQAKSFWFLSVSKSESFGIALMEAVVSGVPSFAYELDTFKQIYKNNEIIFSPIGDTKSVTKNILTIFKNNNFNNKNGSKLINKYSWQNIAKTEYKHINEKHI